MNFSEKIMQALRASARLQDRVMYIAREGKPMPEELIRRIEANQKDLQRAGVV